MFGEENKTSDSGSLSDEKRHIMKLHRHLFLIKRLWVENNPIVRIQRVWRRHHLKAVEIKKTLEDITN